MYIFQTPSSANQTYMPLNRPIVALNLIMGFVDKENRISPDLSF